MADEVTKKDLQSLQGYCNKQIADVEKRLTAKIDALEKSVVALHTKAIGQLDKNDAELLRGHEDQTKRLDSIVKTIEGLVATVNQHAKAINEGR